MTKNCRLLFSVMLTVTWVTAASADGSDGSQTGARLGFDTPAPRLNLVPERSVLLDGNQPWRQAEAARCLEGFVPGDVCGSAAQDADAGFGLGGHAHTSRSGAGAGKLAGVIAALEGAGALLEDK